MQHHKSDGGPGFTLSPSAQEYLLKAMPSWIENSLKSGLVPMLTYSGGGKAVHKGVVEWEFRGPTIVLAGQKRELLHPGKYYDLLGQQIWIEDQHHQLLKGQLWTYIGVGGPEPKECLTIENPPANYLDVQLRGGAGACCRRKTDSKQHL